MKSIKLTQDKVTLVDDDVYEWASKFTWCAIKQERNWYAMRVTSRKCPPRRSILLHRDILKPHGSQEVHHINGDGLDNRRHNLVIATRQQNTHGFQRKRPGKTSVFRGVSWYIRHKKWKAEIKLDGQGKHLGYFNCEEDAARAYNKAAKELFGEFAQMNIFS